LSGYVLAGAVVTSRAVRETFGYSFSTWRFHLRGESIRGAQDVGWMRELTVARMMRTDMATFAEQGTIGALRTAFPLGARRMVVLVDGAGAYAGLVRVVEAHAAEHDPAEAASRLATHRDHMLLPAMNVKEAALAFDAAQAEDLAVVDDPATRRLVGLLGEAHVLRRYAEELDKARKGLGAEA